MEILGIIVIGAIIGYFVYKKQKDKNYKLTILDIMTSNYGFSPNHYQIMANNCGAIGIDTRQMILCIINENTQVFYLRGEDILNTDILIDQDTYLQKDFIKTWSKYFLLKTIASDKTAEASVHISKEKHINKIKTLKLRIGTSNIDHPNHYLLFLKNGTDKHKSKIINDVYDWITRIETVKLAENQGFIIQTNAEVLSKTDETKKQSANNKRDNENIRVNIVKKGTNRKMNKIKVVKKK